MDVSDKALDTVRHYIQWRQQQARAFELEDTLQARLAHLSRGEIEAYDHVVGMWDIANNRRVDLTPTFTDQQPALFPATED